MRPSPPSGRLASNGNKANARKALRLGQFIPYFQPLVDLRSGQLAGFEILARWQHPEHGLIPPDHFIPLAEKHGWIDALTQQILSKAFAESAAIPEPLTLSINISPVQLRSASLPDLIREAAAASGFPMTRLIIELTESALIDNLDHALDIAKQLKQMGCRLSLDDFGTGYSSLLHLQALPFDELKVDHSFVASMTESRESRKIVAGVVGLGQSLGLRTVAEGIETREHAETMLWLGCELGQGWFFGRPVPAADLSSVVATHRQKLLADEPSPWKQITSSNLAGSLSQRIANLQAIYDGSPVGLCFLDTNLRHVSVNQRLAEISGHPAADHIGRSVEELLPPQAYAHIEPYLRRALAGEAVSGVEITAPLDQGNVTSLSSYQPARDEAGEIIGVSVAVLDITRSRRAEQALRTSEDRYLHTTHLSPHIQWIMNAEGGNLEVGPKWEDITGQTPEQTAASGFQAVIHPEDLAIVMPVVGDSLATGKPIDVEFRVRTRDANWLWIRSRGQARRDPDGQIVEWYGSAEDITELKTMKLAGHPQPVPAYDERSLDAVLLAPQKPVSEDLNAAIAHLLGPDWNSMRHIFEAVTNGITVVDARDPEMPILYVNAAFERMTGYRLEEVRGRNCRLLQGTDTSQSGLAPLRHAIGERRDVKTILRNFRKDGTPFWNELFLSPIRDHDGNVTHYVGIQNDVTARIELEAQLAHSANHDMLTGLSNRSLLMDRLSHALARAKRSGQLVAVLFLDLDNLKAVNDQHGHAAGDLLLKVIGQRLGSSTRKHETVARLGGDEFVVVLEDFDNEEGAGRIKRRLAAEIQRPIFLEREQLNPSASIGMALFPLDGQTPEELLRVADTAMYQVKYASKQMGIATVGTSLLQ